jgi:hypothetical protein
MERKLERTAALLTLSHKVTKYEVWVLFTRDIEK